MMQSLCREAIVTNVKVLSANRDIHLRNSSISFRFLLSYRISTSKDTFLKLMGYSNDLRENCADLIFFVLSVVVIRGIATAKRERSETLCISSSMYTGTPL